MGCLVGETEGVAVGVLVGRKEGLEVGRLVGELDGVLVVGVAEVGLDVVGPNCSSFRVVTTMMMLCCEKRR